MRDLTPREIVAELDRDIVGQADAKRAVAVALRNRWRRQQLSEDLRGQVMPKNILLIGPTGVGKTEIARRLAKLVGAPFVKVEASKYTEVGYYGRDVESLVRDLVEAAVTLVKAAERERVAGEAAGRVDARLLDLLLPPPPPTAGSGWAGDPSGAGAAETSEAAERRQRSRDKMKARLDAGELEDREVEVTVPGKSGAPPFSVMGAGNMPSRLEMDLQGMFEKFAPKSSQTRRLTVGQARPLLLAQETDALIEPEKVNAAAVTLAEESGIVFLDEIDKIAGDDGAGTRARRLPPGRPARPAAGRRGDHGDHQVRPREDRPRPVHRRRRVPPQQALRPDARTPGPVPDPRRAARPHPRRLRPHPPRAPGLPDPPVPGPAAPPRAWTSSFAPDGIEAMADYAFQVNRSTQNIGARRLHTILERVVEDLSFDAPAMAGKTSSSTPPSPRPARLAGQGRRPEPVHPLTPRRDRASRPPLTEASRR